MDVARDVRQAALETLAQIAPRQLAHELQGTVADASMLPGAVTVLTAEALEGRITRSHVVDRAVGVQLSYDGLRLTRQLIREEDRYDSEEPTDSYLSLVASEVLVARGFCELADTAVAKQAIDIVQRFSRNQTVDYRSGPHPQRSGQRSLERDVIALAVSAGATAMTDAVPPGLNTYAEQLALELDEEPLPPADHVIDHIRNGVHHSVVAGDAVLLND